MTSVITSEFGQFVFVDQPLLVDPLGAFATVPLHFTVPAIGHTSFRSFGADSFLFTGFYDPVLSTFQCRCVGQAQATAEGALADAITDSKLTIEPEDLLV